MTLDKMKEHFFAEEMELGLASEADIQRLCAWLEANDYDADMAYALWDDYAQELDYMVMQLVFPLG